MYVDRLLYRVGGGERPCFQNYMRNIVREKVQQQPESAPLWFHELIRLHVEKMFSRQCHDFFFSRKTQNHICAATERAPFHQLEQGQDKLNLPEEPFTHGTLHRLSVCFAPPHAFTLRMILTASLPLSLPLPLSLSLSVFLPHPFLFVMWFDMCHVVAWHGQHRWRTQASREGRGRRMPRRP